MTVLKKDVEYLAELARLSFSEEEKENLIGDLKCYSSYEKQRICK